MSDIIKNITFHEKKSRNLIMPYIETQFHVTDIIKFLKWCDEEGKVSDGMWDYLSKALEKMKLWKRPEPKYEFHFKGKTVYIYPKQNIVAVAECGIHYICQHSFDILPRTVKASIYGYVEFNLGMLFSLVRRGKRAELIVKNTDIHKGFLLHRKEIDEYGDSFVFWVKTRREIDEMKKP